MTKEKYPEGSLIKLIHMDDKQAPPDGTLGTVRHSDDMGTIHMKWETGSTLGLIPGEDEFEVIRKGPPVVFRLEATVRMSRPFTENDWLSPGGYTMNTNGKSVQFDFEDTEWGIDVDDPTLVHFMQKNPDYTAFPELETLTSDDLAGIESLTNVYIYTEEEDVVPVEVLNAEIYDVRCDKSYPVKAILEV